MHLDDFKDRHAGAVAWLFGAGPSLDAFLAHRTFIPAEDLVVAVNEVPIILAKHGIECSYGFAADPTDRFAAALPAAMPLFLSDTAVQESKVGNRASPRDMHVAGVFRGSVILAAHVLRHMGVSQIICVGLDGGPERAAQAWISPPSLCRRAYSIIRELFVAWTHRAGLPVTFWSSAAADTRPAPGSLGSFLHRHQGATGFIVGKGPSLDAFLAGEHRLATPVGFSPVIALLNDTVRYRREITAAVAALRARESVTLRDPVPLAAYAFANDSIAPWAHCLDRDLILFQPRRTVRDVSMPAPAPACQRIEFEDIGGDLARLALPPEALVARGLVAHHGTCDTAAQVLKLMGCTRLVAVGCDGTPGRSARAWLTDMREDHADDYAALRSDFERVLLGLGLPTEFYGEPRILRRATPPGTAPNALRITRPTVLRGRPVDVGTEITDCTPAEHQLLVGCGKAEEVFTPA